MDYSYRIVSAPAQLTFADGSSSTIVLVMRLNPGADLSTVVLERMSKELISLRVKGLSISCSGHIMSLGQVEPNPVVLEKLKAVPEDPIEDFSDQGEIDTPQKPSGKRLRFESDPEEYVVYEGQNYKVEVLRDEDAEEEAVQIDLEGMEEEDEKDSAKPSNNSPMPEFKTPQVKKVKENDCDGCRHNSPSQRSHTCLYKTASSSSSSLII